MGEGRPEVCPVNVALVLGAGVIDILALGAEDLDCASPRDVGLPDLRVGLWEVLAQVRPLGLL